jgi:aryl-alcohol dehydrogenase-like predicted oxidoreductase
MLHRERVENEILPVAVKNGMGLVVFSPLAQGMLTGKYDNGIVADTRFAREDWAAKEVFTADNVAKVQGLKSIAESLGISRSQLALAWALRDPSVSSVITGATKAEQVLENVRAAEVKLSDDTIAQIENVLAQTATANAHKG